MKNYYHILRISKYATPDDIKRAYRRLASRYHPDVNPSQDAHAMFLEIHEAYEVLSDSNTRWIYDQRMAAPVTTTGAPIYSDTSTPPRSQTRRRGRFETKEEKLARKLYVNRRNKSFNKKMKLLSVISLVFALSIFLDHYLPSNSHVELATYSFDPQTAYKQPDVTYAIMFGKTPISMYATQKLESENGLGENVGLFYETRIWGVLSGIQLKNIFFEPVNSLYPIMLIYGFICIASITVLFYKIENDLFYPTFVTFFCHIFILAFMVLKITY